MGLPPEVVEPLFGIFKYMCTMLVTVRILIGTFMLVEVHCLHASQLRGKFWLSFDPADSDSRTNDLGEGAVTDGVSVQAGARKCSVYIDESWR